MNNLKAGKTNYIVELAWRPHSSGSACDSLLIFTTLNMDRTSKGLACLYMSSDSIGLIWAGLK